MKRSARKMAAWRTALGLGAAAFLGGCQTAPTHTVSVDAITASPEKLAAASFRLVPHDPVLAHDVAQFNQAAGCLAAALEGRGLFAAPGNVAPDILIDVDYGEAPLLVLPGAPRTHELYLQLSARTFLADAPARNYRGEEIWNVRVSVSERDPRIATVMPLLAAVAVEYAGSDHQPDEPINVKESDPMVVAAKNAAVAAKVSP